MSEIEFKKCKHMRKCERWNLSLPEDNEEDILHWQGTMMYCPCPFQEVATKPANWRPSKARS